VAVNGFDTQPPPQPSGGRDWRSGPSLLIGAGAVVVTLVVVALAVQELGPGATLWWIIAAAVLFGIARQVRMRRLTTDAFMHVKDLIKAEQFEAYKAMRRRYRVARRETRRRRPLGRMVDEGGMHPPTLIRVANPHDYVKLHVGPLPWPRLQDIHSVTVRWTPLVQTPSAEFFNNLTEAVAHFLSVSPGAVVAHHPDLPRKKVTFALR
jgi:hypothetical protein